MTGAADVVVVGAGAIGLSAAWRPRLDERIRLLERLRDRLDSCIGCGCLSLSACRLVNPGDAVSSHGPGPRVLLED